MKGLSGFPQAIEAVYSQMEIHSALSTRYAILPGLYPNKDIKKLMSDLKRVYAAPTEDTALNELELFRDN